jgi:acetate kinase
VNDAILVINTGSSSIKFAVYRNSAGLELVRCVAGSVQGIGTEQVIFNARILDDARKQGAIQQALTAIDHAQALQHILAWLDSAVSQWRLLAVGHRVVHGGTRFTTAVKVDEQVLTELKALIPLAPLHQPHAVHAIESLSAQTPALAQIACFDTAFHAKMPRHEQHFALPPALEQQGIRRYGFHGLSYEYICRQLPQHLGEMAAGRVVIAHLGHGVSMCAVQELHSIATTMSFTPLDGLPMGTRSGALDPAIVLYLQGQGMSPEEVADLLHHRAGLLGLSGISDDMQTLLASEQASAAQAVDYFCYRISRELGSLAAALGGLDALVFTGGIGERAAAIRAQVCELAAWLGVILEPAANQENALRISSDRSQVSVWVIPTEEEQVIAHHTLSLMSAE